MTSTEKWNDSWFLDLSQNGKLLFLFLCDKCDIAGFFERHDKSASFLTGIPLEDFQILYDSLSKSLVISENMIWLKNFIRHQKNLPLNPDNKCHQAIIRSLLEHQEAFGSFYESFLGFSVEELSTMLGACKGLARPYSNSNTNSNKGVLGGNKRQKTPEELQMIEDMKKESELRIAKAQVKQ